MKWCIKNRDNSSVDQSNGALVLNTIVCGIYVLKTNRTSTNRVWITEISNLSRKSESGFDSDRMDGNAFSCYERVQWGEKSTTLSLSFCFGCLSLLAEHSAKSGWNLKRFEYFTSISHSFAQMMFGFSCCFSFKCQSMRSGKIRKYFFPRA